jgi:putative N-acetylmannosamine-6-phosphate epimerase
VTTPASPRVTAAMRSNAKYVLSTLHTYTDMDEFIHNLCLAVITADDPTTRYVVGTRDPHGNTIIYGPYATADAAHKALDSGACAHIAGTQGDVYPLVPSPKIPRTRKKKEAS